MTTATQKPEVGDEVTFHGGTRGRHKGQQTGIIIGFHYKEFRGRRRELNEQFGGEPGREMLKVQSGTTIWKISPALVKITKKKAADPVAASREGAKCQAEIKSHNNQIKHEVRSTNFDKADESGLFDLKRGDKVEVSLHDRYGNSSWYACTFVEIVRGSGRIKVKQESFPKDRVFSTPPQFVRVPAK